MSSFNKEPIGNNPTTTERHINTENLKLFISNQTNLDCAQLEAANFTLEDELTYWNIFRQYKNMFPEGRDFNLPIQTQNQLRALVDAFFKRNDINSDSFVTDMEKLFPAVPTGYFDLSDKTCTAFDKLWSYKKLEKERKRKSELNKVFKIIHGLFMNNLIKARKRAAYYKNISVTVVRKALVKESVFNKITIKTCVYYLEELLDIKFTESDIKDFTGAIQLARRKFLDDPSFLDNSPSSFKVPINTNQPLQLKSIQTSKGIVEVPDILVDTNQWKYINKGSKSPQQASDTSSFLCEETQYITTGPEVQSSQKMPKPDRSPAMKRKSAQQTHPTFIPFKKQKMASNTNANIDPNTGKDLASSQGLSKLTPNSTSIEVQNIMETPPRRNRNVRRRNQPKKDLRNVN